MGFEKDDRIIYARDGVENLNYAFSHKCYNCGKDVACSVEYVDTFQPPDGEARYVFYGKCPRCNYPAIAVAKILRKNVFLIEDVFPQRKIPETPQNLPDKIKKLYDEFKQAYTDRRTPITVVMLGRSMLEAMLKDVNDKPMKLKDRIRKLAKDCVIPESLFEVADTIRTLGNDAVHEIDGIDNNDAEDIWGFVNVFIDYMYVMPAKVESLKKKHNLSLRK